MGGIEQHCIICSGSEVLLQVREKRICEKCIHEGLKKLIASWKDTLESLFSEYAELCHKCLTAENPEIVHQSRVTGRKIRAMLEFIGLPKRHELLLIIKKVHLNLSKLREADVLLNEFNRKRNENIVYQELAKIARKTHREQKERLLEIIPEMISAEFNNRVDTFLNDELGACIVSLDKNNRLHHNEERFDYLVNEYRVSAQDNGKTSDAAIQALHGVRKKAKSLRYIYHYFNEVYECDYKNKELFSKNLQNQLGEIIDTNDWLYQIKTNEKKLNVPKREIEIVKNSLQHKLHELLEKNVLDEEKFFR